MTKEIVTLYDLVNGALHRLDDDDAEIYSREEVALYIKDGYDLMCRGSKCLFDIVCVENLPAVGSHSSDEQYMMALQIPRLRLADKSNFTREIDREFAQAGDVGPASVTSHADIPLLSSIEGVVVPPSPVGQLPRGYVEIERVSHDQITIYPEFSYGLARQRDNRYESQGGDPDWFTMDKDGIFSLRRYPTGDGAAVYDEVEGAFGVETYDSEYTGDIVGDWGLMCFDSEEFPSEGPWGGPTRKHPGVNNTIVELTRLGRDLDHYPMEIPHGYKKYIEFWACSRAKAHDGEGQDLELSKHYAERFNAGVKRLKDRVRSVQSEHTGRIGHGPQNARVPPLKISLPYNYGRSVRRNRRY